MFDNLTDRLQLVLQKISGKDKLTADNVDSALVEVRKALLEADVSLKVVKLFLDRIRHSAIGERVVQGVTPSQKFIQIVHQELTSFLGGTIEPLNLKDRPSLILLLGLQGSGKTTTAAKLALKLKKENKKVLLVALDLQRPAAIEQLSILAEQIEVEIYKDTESKDVLKVGNDGWLKANSEKFDIVIFDTAGRLQIDNELMAELLLLDKKYKPKEKLLVIDSLIGQEAVNVAEAFNTQIGITGSILTKLDGDSRGGAALSLVEGTGTKVKFIGLGEKIEPLEEFVPERIANRILGFGDIISLVNSIEERIDKTEAEQISKRLEKGELNFELFLQMQRMIGKIGNLSQVFGLLGMNSMLKIDKKERESILEEGQFKLKRYEYAIQSMTIKERRKPDLINTSRIKRIAKGAGLNELEVTNLITEFNKMRQVMTVIGPMLKSGGFNINDLMNTTNKSNKKQKQKDKKDKGDLLVGEHL